VTVALNTGMRKGEILGLAWESVDLSTSRLSRPNSVVLKTPK
jgi:integrase